jgi:hypothetical protein
MTITPFADFRAPARATALPLKFDAFGLPVTAAAVDGIGGRFEVDVRAPVGLLFTPFVRQWRFVQRYARERPLKRSGLGPQYAVRRISVGGRTFRKVPMWFSTGKQSKFGSNVAAGLLGNDLLSHFSVTLDYRDRLVILSPQPHL